MDPVLQLPPVVLEVQVQDQADLAPVVDHQDQHQVVQDQVVQVPVQALVQVPVQALEHHYHTHKQKVLLMVQLQNQDVMLEVDTIPEDTGILQSMMQMVML